MKQNFPITGYLSHWPSRRIVKVRVEECKRLSGEYPLQVVSLDPSVDISNGRTMYSNARFENGFCIASLDVITLWKTRRAAEKEVLEQLHKEYATKRRELRAAQKAYKCALKRVEEWKAFKEILTPFDT